MSILFAGNDYWAPVFHKQDLQKLVDRGVLPFVDLRQNLDLKHDFITSEDQTMFVVDYCIESIQGTERPRAKL